MKTFFGKCFFSFLLLAGVVLAPAGSRNVSSALAAPTSDSNCVLTWKPVSAPSPSSDSSTLNGISFASASEGWAVGSWWAQGQTNALIEHWNGDVWSTVPIHSLPAPNSELNSVTAISADDVWAVGSDWPPALNPEKQPLMLHWDGTRWSYVSAPAANGWFSSVSATASDDVWGVGPWNGSFPSTSLLFHWDGHTWVTITPPTTAYFIQVVARTRDDVWVLAQNGTTAQILHWDGAAWSVHSTIPLPTSPFSTTASGLAVIAPNDMWVIGYQYDGTWVTHRIPEAYHWDGAQWQAFPPSGAISYRWIRSDRHRRISIRSAHCGRDRDIRTMEWGRMGYTWFPPGLGFFL